jgi:hypothetical protein
MFEKLFPHYDQTYDSNQTNGFEQKKFSKLINLFQSCENYYSIMIFNRHLSEEIEIKNIATNTENISHRTKILKKEFYKCGLCYHYLNDPIT